MSDCDPILDGAPIFDVSLGDWPDSEPEMELRDSDFNELFGNKNNSEDQAVEPEEAAAVQQEEAVDQKHDNLLDAQRELLETTRQLREEKELSRKYKAQLKAAKFSHEELFNCLKDNVDLKLFPTFSLVRSTVKDSHLQGGHVWVAFRKKGPNYRDDSRVVFQIKFLVDDVAVEREVPCITLLRTGSSPGIWCFKLRRSEDDQNSFAVVHTLKSEGSRNKPAVDAKTAAQVAQQEENGRRKSVRKHKGGVEGANDHDELDDDAPASKKQKDFCMRLSKLLLWESIGPMEAVFCVAGSDGRLRVTKKPDENDRVVCATVTSNIKGCHGGSKPLAIHFPDEIENGIDVVLTGRDLVVNLSNVTVKDGLLELGGFLFGATTAVPVGRDEPPAGFVFARVFGLMDAINKPECSRYLRCLTEDPEELGQLGCIAARSGNLGVVKRCVSSLQTSVYLSNDITGGWRKFYAATNSMFEASLLEVEVLAFLYDYVDDRTRSVFTSMFQEVQ